jgi:hypothetical protein
METTPRLGLPYILQSQSQKEVTHNEALNAIDAMLQPMIEAAALTAPPPDAAEGGLWIVGEGATDEWAGKDGMLAQRLGVTWVFLMPPEGFAGWLKDAAVTIRRLGSGWETGVVKALRVEIGGTAVLGPQQGAVADAAGGVTVDNEARTALNALLAACRAHGLISS